MSIPDIKITLGAQGAVTLQYTAGGSQNTVDMTYAPVVNTVIGGLPFKIFNNPDDEFAKIMIPRSALTAELSLHFVPVQEVMNRYVSKLSSISRASSSLSRKRTASMASSHVSVTSDDTREAMHALLADDDELVPTEVMEVTYGPPNHATSPPKGFIAKRGCATDVLAQGCAADANK